MRRPDRDHSVRASAWRALADLVPELERERAGLCDGINRLYARNLISFDEQRRMSRVVLCDLRWWGLMAFLRGDFGCHRWRRTPGGYRARMRFCARMAEQGRVGP